MKNCMMLLSNAVQLLREGEEVVVIVVVAMVMVMANGILNMGTLTVGTLYFMMA